MKENQRHNVVTEGETSRHNQVSEGIDISNLAETKRHNVANEKEANRHNTVTEAQGQQQLDETKRHNIAGETLNLGQLQETKRHNVASERLQGTDLNIKANTLAETSRHNIEQEAIGQIQAQGTTLRGQASYDLAQLQKEWASIQNLTGIELDRARTNEINAKIRQIENQIKNLDRQTDINQVNTIWSNVNGSIRSLSDLIDTVANLYY